MRWPTPLVAGLALGALVWPAHAAAQAPEQVPQAFERVTFGGELSAVAGRRDTLAFFNYTDYEHNALRIARLRLLAEWRVGRQVSVLGEIRTENGEDADLAALYVRWRPWAGKNLDIQIGRVPPVVGAFGRRSYGRDNPVVGSPLAYQYLTSLRPDALPATIDDLLRMRARGWQPSFPIGSQVKAPGIPLVSSARWDTGIEAHGQYGQVELAGAFTLGSPAEPVVRDTNDGREWSGRVAVHAPSGLTIGLSGARGQWIDRSVLALVPEALRSNSEQSLVGLDVELMSGRWLVRAEGMRSVFQVPVTGAPTPAMSLPAWSSFVEARYRVTPRWQLAARVERLGFGRVTGASAGSLPTPWDAQVDRVEAVLGVRLRRDLEIRGGWQQDWRQAGRVRKLGFPMLQVLYWF
jgi:hypothetical protein